MKKGLALLLSVLLAASLLTGCGEKEGDRVKDMKLTKYLTLNGEYTGLPISIEEIKEVTEENVKQVAIQAYTSKISAEYGGITERAVENGDTINLDYAGTKDGVAFQGGTAANQTLEIGSNRFIEGFESGLVGVMPGETVDLNLSFPEGYDNEELAGQPVVFTVTVNYIYPTLFEEMKEEAIDYVTSGQYKTIDEYVTSCREYLEETEKDRYNNDRETAIITALESIATFKKIPEVLIDKYTKSLTDTINNAAASYGVDVDTLCNYFFQSDAATYIANAAETNARQAMVIQHIANLENLNVSDEELETSLQDTAQKNGFDSVEALLESGDKEDFREYLTFQKVIDFIYEHALVNKAAETQDGTTPETGVEK